MTGAGATAAVPSPATKSVAERVSAAPAQKAEAAATTVKSGGTFKKRGGGEDGSEGFQGPSDGARRHCEIGKRPTRPKALGCDYGTYEIGYSPGGQITANSAFWPPSDWIRNKCLMALHIPKCFEIYYTEVDY